MDRGYKLIPEGLGNCSFDLPAELCSDKSETKRNLSLTSKKKSHVLKNRNSGTQINTDTKRICHSVRIIRVSVSSGQSGKKTSKHMFIDIKTKADILKRTLSNFSTVTLRSSYLRKLTNIYHSLSL